VSGGLEVASDRLLALMIGESFLSNRFYRGDDTPATPTTVEAADGGR